MSVVVFLVLGLTRPNIMLPMMSGLSAPSEKPKPRPRAIIKNQSKSSNSTVKKIGVIFALGTNSPRQLPIVVGIVEPLEKPRPIAFLALPSGASRAPPVKS